MLRASVNYLFLTAVMLVSLSSFASGAEKLKQAMSIYADDKGASIKYPEGATCSDAGQVIVADTGNGRLLRYTYQDGALKGGAEVKLPQLSYPIRVQLNAKGEIFALDGKLHRIVRINPDGSFAGYFDPQRVAAPAAVVPRSFKLDSSGNVYLLDIFGERVLVLDQSGNYLKKIEFPDSTGFFSDLAVNAGGDVFLLDSVNSMVFVARKDATAFTPLSKNLQEYMNFPTYITPDNKGGLYMVDQNGGAVLTLGQDGSFTGRLLGLGWKEGQLYYPAQICLIGNDVMVVADRSNSRMQLFEFVK
jgi:hypothetical protein